ncbi:MAG TPA: hypothetical protein VEV17_09210 [Bryobacteraceae bacterium]|nr:hypothetical protein [Bryobacteraceae bacterium]
MEPVLPVIQALLARFHDPHSDGVLYGASRHDCAACSSSAMASFFLWSMAGMAFGQDLPGIASGPLRRVFNPSTSSLKAQQQFAGQYGQAAPNCCEIRGMLVSRDRAHPVRGKGYAHLNLKRS